MSRVLPFVVLVSGCVLPQVVPEALSTEFKATGEVRAHERTASFDQVRVRNPKMNITKRTDGSWGGTFNEHGVDVSVDETSVRGVDLVLTKKESTPEKLVITGQFQGRIVRFELTHEQALIRTQTTSLTLAGRVVQDNGVAYGPRGELVLLGDAGKESPPWPQLAFALMAAFD
jgi:hypothetical protein